MEAFEALFHLPLTTVLGLLAIAFFAGIVDAIAGGGGMLNVPAMMLAGLDPVSAVATNKLQGTFGVTSAVRSYSRAGLIDWRSMRGLVAASAIGAALGAIVAQKVPSDGLRIAVPFLLIALAIFVATSPKLTDTEAHRRLSFSAFAVAFAVPIGFYDGFFGPGGGTFFFLALVTLLGQGVTRAAGNAKLLNLASNAGSLLLFAFSGKIWWVLGVALGLSAFAGAQVGAAQALKRGAALIKPVVVLMAIAMALRLLFDASHPVGGWLRGLFH